MKTITGKWLAVHLTWFCVGVLTSNILIGLDMKFVMATTIGAAGYAICVWLGLRRDEL